MNAKIQAFHMCCPITVADWWDCLLTPVHNEYINCSFYTWCNRHRQLRVLVARWWNVLSLLVLCFTSSVADRTWKCRCLVQCFVWNKKHVRSSQFGVCSITFSRVTFRVTFIIATWCNSCISCISTQESHNKLFLEGKLNKYWHVSNVHLHS